MAEQLDHFEFPAFIKNLPEADTPYAGVRSWVVQSERGQVVFNEADTEVDVVEHSHGDQWGVVLEGRVDLFVAGQKQVCYAGDSYFIPADIPHGMKIYPGTRSVDYFADRERHKLRPTLAPR
ncbi:MAG: cupin domain-containing protein [Chloroflexota bacterium]